MRAFLKSAFTPLLIFLAVGYFLFNLRDLFISRPLHKPLQLSISKQPIVENKSFVILIFSFNQVQLVEKNLRSVFEQCYPHFRVIYIDDASTDGTFEKAEAFVQELGQADKITFLHNESPQSEVANYQLGIQLCEDHEIVLLLNGKDWLAHEQVLTWLNRCYQDPSIWMTYGSMCEYPAYKRSTHNRPISQKLRDPCTIPPLTTAYANLLKKIPVKGKSLADLIIPAFELASEHSRYIRDILYIQNRQKMQMAEGKEIK